MEQIIQIKMIRTNTFPFTNIKEAIRTGQKGKR